MPKKKLEEVNIKVLYDPEVTDEDDVVGEVEDFLEMNFGHDVARVKPLDSWKEEDEGEDDDPVTE